jgi:lambda family phage portal protein
VAYWLYREHPNDGVGLGATGAAELVRVPAEQILHIFDAVRPGQLRGEPRLARVLLTASDLELYDNAELKRKQLAATITGWIKRALGIDGTPLVDNDATATEAGTVEQKMEPGTLSVLNEGEEVQFAPAADSGQTYDAFQRRTLLRLAAGMGITYEQLTGDMLNVNYSSARVALIEFRRLCEQDVYTGFVPQLCDPVFRAFMVAAVANGLLPGLGMRESARAQATYTAANWVMTKWDWIDPQKEITAFRESVRCGFQTRSAIIRSLGDDPEQVDREMAADQQRADRHGLLLDSDARTDHPQPTMGSAPDEAAVPARPRRAA